MVSSLWPPSVLGGAESYAATLADRLAAAGDEIGAVTVGVEGPQVVASARPWPYRLDAFATQPVRKRMLFHLHDLWSPTAARTLRGAIERFRPDVVHSHSVQGFSMAALSVPSRAGVPHVHTVHDYWLLCQRTSMARRDGILCEQRCRSCQVFSTVRAQTARAGFPDVIIAPSKAIADAHAGFAPAQGLTRVVRHPVEAHPGRPIDRTTTPGAPVTFGFLGQLTVPKGIPTLLDAFTRLEQGSVRLLVAGRGALEDLVLASAAPVESLGWVDATQREAFFARIDCLVVPSAWHDPAPLVINEAKARDVPVIGTTMGGIPELVPRRCQALLVPAGDRDALADALRRFADDPARFAVEPDDKRPSWNEHLEAIRAAYADAAIVG